MVEINVEKFKVERLKHKMLKRVQDNKTGRKLQNEKIAVGKRKILDVRKIEGGEKWQKKI